MEFTDQQGKSWIQCGCICKYVQTIRNRFLYSSLLSKVEGLRELKKIYNFRAKYRNLKFITLWAFHSLSSLRTVIFLVNNCLQISYQTSYYIYQTSDTPKTMTYFTRGLLIPFYFFISPLCVFDQRKIICTRKTPSTTTQHREFLRFNRSKSFFVFIKRVNENLIQLTEIYNWANHQIFYQKQLVRFRRSNVMSALQYYNPVFVVRSFKKGISYIFRTLLNKMNLFHFLEGIFLRILLLW